MTNRKYNSSVTSAIKPKYKHKTYLYTLPAPGTSNFSRPAKKYIYGLSPFSTNFYKIFIFIYLNCSNEVTAGTVGTLSKTGPAVGRAEGRWNPWLPTEGPWPLVAAVKRSKLAASGLEAATPAADGPVSWKVRAGRSRKDCGVCWDSCCKLLGCCCSCCCCCAGCRGRKENCCSEVTAPCKRHTIIVVYSLTIIGGHHYREMYE
jgi:hypothetical protein